MQTVKEVAGKDLDLYSHLNLPLQSIYCTFDEEIRVVSGCVGAKAAHFKGIFEADK